MSGPKISVLFPTHRTSYSAIARIFEAASLDADRFELVVRDNSNNVEKREILERINSPALRLLNVPNKGAFENFVEALRVATGEFVVFWGDDDWISIRGLERLYSRLEPISNDRTWSAGTGDYLVESSGPAGLVRYSDIDSPSAEARIASYLATPAPNVLFYSVIRRALAQRGYELIESFPYKLSFHDQLVSLVYLASGRIATVERVVYFYNLGIWETSEGTLEKDRSTYREAGLPIEVDRLHWLICAMEGAYLLRSKFLSDYPYDRGRTVDAWFSTYFTRFKHLTRESGYSSGLANDATQRVREKWIDADQANLNELLLDICDVFEAVDKPGAERYFNYWSTL
jgi:hypothetical protein